ncbi:MAG: nucleotide disphospho-sugar-binding domain-containing protein, partial [Pseudomonadota bacterium]|nr:nucleotide disphospho-sugar-binding domain-containing protein [Pseudomonadota bacterium]
VVTASITDPYRAYREAPTLLPFNMPRGIHPRPLADRRPKGVFLYLPSGHPAVRNIVYGLRGAGLDCDAYLSDLPAASIEKLTGPGFRVHARPVSFAKMLPEVRLVVHYAGLSTAIAAAKAGTPQLIAPWNLEHAVTARGVADAVGARLIADDASTAVVGKTARAMIDDDRLAARALAGADMFPDHDPAPTLDRIAAACKELAG